MTGYILPLQPSTQTTFESTTKISNSYRQNIFASYNLKWRQNILWVAPHTSGTSSFPVAAHQLVNRLQQSPVKCVCIDAGLGETHVNAWQEACSKAGKRLHIRESKANRVTAVAPRNWSIKHSWNQLVAYLGQVATVRA